MTHQMAQLRISRFTFLRDHVPVHIIVKKPVSITDGNLRRPIPVHTGNLQYMTCIANFRERRDAGVASVLCCTDPYLFRTFINTAIDHDESMYVYSDYTLGHAKNLSDALKLGLCCIISASCSIDDGHHDDDTEVEYEAFFRPKQ